MGPGQAYHIDRWCEKKTCLNGYRDMFNKNQLKFMIKINFRPKV